MASINIFHGILFSFEDIKDPKIQISKGSVKELRPFIHEKWQCQFWLEPFSCLFLGDFHHVWPILQNLQWFANWKIDLNPQFQVYFRAHLENRLTFRNNVSLSLRECLAFCFGITRKLKGFFVENLWCS